MTQLLSPEEKKTLVDWRRDFHANPELGYTETRTSNIVASHLESLGYEVRRCVGGTGVVGLLRGKAAGKTLMLRADMDCLPMQEENEVPYASQNPGKMHACGHDGHTAVLMMTAKKLMERKSDLRGNIKLVFQPAEEGGNGALAMIRDGVLKDPKVDTALGLHVFNNLPTGKVGLNPGPLMAGVDLFEVTIEGVGGHAAAPHQTVDPVVTAAHVVTALQTVVSRNVDPIHSCVVTVGSIHAGNAFNVIPRTAELKGTVRYFDPKIGQALPQWVERVIRGTVESMGARYDLKYERIGPPTINDPVVAGFMRDVSAEIVGEENVFFNERVMGGEDMAYYLEQVPGCFVFVGSANEAKKLNYPHHSPRFDFDEEALETGVKIFMRAVEKFQSL